MFAFLQSLAGPVLKHVIKMAGNSIGMGFPVGEVLVECWEGWGKRKSEAELHQAIAQVAQEQREAKRQVALLIDQIAANQPEHVKQQAAAFLNMVPAAIQRSLRRPDDLSGRTVPKHLRIRGPADLQQFLPDRLPRFKIGDRPLAGTDLVLEKFIGMGGFGEVWKAIHQSRPHAPPVALKFCTDPSAAKSLHREVELLDRVAANKGRLKNIVELRYAHLQADPPCLEYEYVDGGDLTDLLCELHEQKKATPSLIAQIMLQLSNAVGSAHDIQPPIIHRDLKPANVLVQRTGSRVSLKVADFGIGMLASDLALEEAQHAPAETTSAQAFTPLYASPQQRMGRPADPRDDVYALGVIWYQLLIGDLNAEAPRGSAWKRRLAKQGMSADLIAILEECLEDQAEDRPKNAVVVAKHLSENINSRQQEPTLQPMPSAEPPREKPPQPEPAYGFGQRIDAFDEEMERQLQEAMSATEPSSAVEKPAVSLATPLQSATPVSGGLTGLELAWIESIKGKTINEELMREVEKAVGVPKQGRKEFRREMLERLRAAALDGSWFSANETLQKVQKFLAWRTQQENTSARKQDVKQVIPMKTAVDDEEHLTPLEGHWIASIIAYMQGPTAPNPVTGMKEEPDEEIMCAVEQTLGVPETDKNNFRHEMNVCLGASVLDGRRFYWTKYKPLQKAKYALAKLIQQEKWSSFVR